jgi:hypothetical protein
VRAAAVLEAESLVERQRLGEVAARKDRDRLLHALDPQALSSVAQWSGT